MTISQLPARALTHGGKFHADDVFSAALLLICKPELEILRTFDVPADFDGLVFDIGWGAFDHHQSDAPKRENGVPYAAFGLLWRELGPELLGAAEAGKFDEKFVQSLDLEDNTGCGHPLADVVGLFNPSWDSDRSPDDCFTEAVGFVKIILEKRIEFVRSFGRGYALVQSALCRMQDNIAILPRFAPWKPVLVDSAAEFVIYPSQRGGYSAQAVPSGGENGALKQPFPADWAGKNSAELQALTGLATLRFCHNSRFLIAAGTLEDAVSACRLARGGR